MSSEGLRGTRFWGEEEAVFLLRQLKEPNIFKWLDGRKIRNAEVFKKVAKKMEEAGFIRTFEQIKMKWNSMKRIYFVTKRKIKINGHNSVPCPYFELLDDLLGGRALSQTCGLDVGLGASVSESVPKDQREPTDDPEKHPDEEDAVEMEETAETEERETDSPPVLKTKTRTGERQRPRGRRSDVKRFTSSMERFQTVLVDQLRQSQEMQERLVNTILQSNESMVSALLEGIQSLRPRPPDQRGEKDVHQLNGHQSQGEPRPPTPNVNVEVEDGEPEEADLTKMAVKTEDHEDKPPESFMASSQSPRLERRGCKYDVQQMICQEEHAPQLQGGTSTWKQEDPHPLHFKKEEVDPQPPQVKEEEEKEALWITQEGEFLPDLAKLPLTPITGKTEDHEDKPPESSQLHHSPSEENRGAEPQHMTTEADGDHRGGSQADNLLAPLSDSDDTTSYSPEAEDQDITQKPLSSNTDREDDLRTHTDNKDSECSKKKTGKKSLTCSVCDKSFSCMSNLSRHMAMHTGEKRFVCSVCGKGYFDRCDLALHMRTHTGEKPYCCSVCGNAYSQRSILTAHMRTHTGERPYSCSICGARFFRQSEVVSHKRMHTGEKPYSCSVCGKRFARKGHLTVHEKLHTGEKPYNCSVCGKRFARKEHLMGHAKVHTGEKAFSCSICGARFVQKSHAVSHTRTHTENKNS
uniref:zinc finger protein 397-like isoform X2 n=1 Tax=Doryrhamphus excisus TaxID=161450 RepID=UPI0025AE5568|nr:zinc finger protein 397-like isoform X2 [Doryrhamphus excisus]